MNDSLCNYKVFFLIAKHFDLFLEKIGFLLSLPLYILLYEQRFQSISVKSGIEHHGTAGHWRRGKALYLLCEDSL